MRWNQLHANPKFRCISILHQRKRNHQHRVHLHCSGKRIRIHNRPHSDRRHRPDRCIRRSLRRPHLRPRNNTGRLRRTRLLIDVIIGRHIQDRGQRRHHNRLRRSGNRHGDPSADSLKRRYSIIPVRLNIDEHRIQVHSRIR